MDISFIQSMGYSEEQAKDALMMSENKTEMAVNLLLSGNFEMMK